MLTHIVTKSFHNLKLQRDMNILQEVYSWTVLICLSMPKQNVCFLNLKLQRDMNIFQFQMLQSSTMFWLQKSWLQSLQLNSFMNCISMPMPKQNLCCICKAFFITYHNLHSNHFVKTAIVTIVTLEWLLSIMNC